MDATISSFNFFVASLANFFFFASLNAFSLLPLYIKTLGGTESQIGWIMGSYSLTAILWQPLAGAFSKVLGTLGPAMNDVFSKLSASLVKLSDSISKNPTALADFARGLGGLASDLIGFVDEHDRIRIGNKQAFDGIEPEQTTGGRVRVREHDAAVGPAIVLNRDFEG